MTVCYLQILLLLYFVLYNVVLFDMCVSVATEPQKQLNDITTGFILLCLVDLLCGCERWTVSKVMKMY